MADGARSYKGNPKQDVDRDAEVVAEGASPAGLVAFLFPYCAELVDQLDGLPEDRLRQGCQELQRVLKSTACQPPWFGA